MVEVVVYMVIMQSVTRVEWHLARVLIGRSYHTSEMLRLRLCRTVTVATSAGEMLRSA